MAGPEPPEDELRASNMKLLETGNFADAEITCGDKTFKIHKAVVCTRSVWFEKALAGPFKEATSAKVNIEEQNPQAIEVILKYIYGGAVNMADETRNRPVIRFCVDLYQAADFLLVKPMLPIVLRRLRDHCHEKLKWLCTRGNVDPDSTDETALIWIRDLLDGIREAYRWNPLPIKKTLMEFVWVGRRPLLGSTWIGIQDDLASTPAFTQGMLRHCTIHKWQKVSAFAPDIATVSFPRRGRCARCNKELAKWGPNGNLDAYGQVYDPFTISAENRVRREWCKECSAMDMIPWRETRS